MSQELAHLGWPVDRITWYPAIDPRSSGGFRNAGYRGCFLSHLAVLNMAGNAGYETALILEDDCAFDPGFNASVAAALANTTWGICYLGHKEQLQSGPAPLVEWPPESRVLLTHCYAVRRAVLPSLCAFLEVLILRPSGSPEGGPMSPDGALSRFRSSHPEIQTVLASPSVAGQRSSRSDLSARWWDRVPIVGQAASAFRHLRKRRKVVDA
jgi:GR25 family glycosyltransferase involved in LPS biosynthesis